MKFNNSVKIKLEKLFRDKDEFSILRLEEIDLGTILDSPYTSSFHEIIFVTEGTFTHAINGIESSLKSCEICTLEEGHVHEIKKIKKVKGFFVRYKNEFIPSSGSSYKTTFYACFKGYLGDDNFRMTILPEEMEQCINMFSLLELEYLRVGSFSVSKGIMQHLLISLVLILERQARILRTERVSNTKNNEKVLYHAFVGLLETHFLEEHSISFYAQELGLSRRKLSEILKKFTKKTAKRIHVERIMLEAKRLLAYSNLSQKQIAYQLGYEHPSYFSNKFKEEFAITPNKYRREKNTTTTKK